MKVLKKINTTFDTPFNDFHHHRILMLFDYIST